MLYSYQVRDNPLDDFATKMNQGSPDYPFFFHDDVHTYFVKPVEVSVWHATKYPDYYPPFVIKINDSNYINVSHYPKVDQNDILPEYVFDGGFADPRPQLMNINGSLMEKNDRRR